MPQGIVENSTATNQQLMEPSRELWYQMRQTVLQSNQCPCPLLWNTIISLSLCQKQKVSNWNSWNKSRNKSKTQHSRNYDQIKYLAKYSANFKYLMYAKVLLISSKVIKIIEKSKDKFQVFDRSESTLQKSPWTKTTKTVFTFFLILWLKPRALAG